jgi:hypothetical protein
MGPIVPLTPKQRPFADQLPEQSDSIIGNPPSQSGSYIEDNDDDDLYSLVRKIVPKSIETRSAFKIVEEERLEEKDCFLMEGNTSSCFALLVALT